ncbi:MAG TPA: peptidoglycan-binding protein LysM [Bacillus bacterium]|nr:peptidoglycan-binding protein LysM [Bacillus sp. (in: firmicutes)]
MNNEKPIRDQAERLRKKVERKTDQSAANKIESLPPRGEIHRQKQKKTKVKVKYPVIRLMALFFILLPITFFSIISYLEGSKGPFEITKELAGVELIDIESSSKAKSDQKAEKDEDEAAPAIEEITESEQIDIAAAPAPISGGDKNSSLSSASNSVKEQKKNSDKAAAVTQPAAEVSAQPPADSSGNEEKVIFHTVQPNETLFRVAIKYYKTQDGIEIIRKANNIKGNEIQAGQVLKIPN